MPAYAERVQDYVSPRQVAPYHVRDRALKEHHRCNYLRLVAAPTDRPVESVESVLRDLRSGDFADRAVRVRQGREQRFLEKEPLVGRLIQALRGAANAEQIIENCFEELFEDLRAGESFEHTEVVMAILFALKQARIHMFQDVATFFAGSRATEVTRLRQFARALLAA